MKKKDLFYVGIQFGLFLLFAIIETGHNSNPIFRYAGLVLSFVGFIILFTSILQLNKNLSPFPSPKNESELVTSGLYSIVRHPIYLGIILLFTGYSCYSSSWYRLAVTLALYILFHFKSEYEEKLLNQKFSEYSEYQKRTNKIIPFI